MVDLRKAAAIVGIYEHPARFAPDKSELLVQAESVIGALADAGLEKKDVDGLFSSSMSVRMANVSLADYMDLYPKHLDDTSVGGASFEFHLGHAVNAIAAGRIDVAVITYSTLPRSGGISIGTGGAARLGAPRLNPAPRQLRGALRVYHRGPLRNAGPASHAPVRHHLGAAGRDSREHPQARFNEPSGPL